MTPEKWGKEVDVIFCCLPHATTQSVIASLPESVKARSAGGWVAGGLIT
jgi:hypothetical protein